MTVQQQMLIRLTSLLQFPLSGGVFAPLDRIDVPGMSLTTIAAALEEL